MAQDFDKIFREVLKDIFPAVAQKVLGLPLGEYKPLPVDLQYTSEREADQVWEVDPKNGNPFILHCEFQSSNDKQMLSRMLLYYGFLHYQRKLPIQQYVIYVGRDKVQMEHKLQADMLSYQYKLIDLRSFPYQTFLESEQSQEVLLAILADFGGEPAELISQKIIAKLEELSSGKLELSQRTLQLVRLAVLRNLGKTVYNTAKKMAITIDIKEDTLYQEGQEAGKEKAATNMLKKGMSIELISEITELPVERVAQLRQQLEASE
jgi:predicted transposase/invertase (TIGR01784 family)